MVRSLKLPPTAKKNLDCAPDLFTRLSSWIEEKAYKEENVKIIKITRNIIKFESLIQRVLFCRFLASAEEVDSELLKRVDYYELSLQYRNYLRRLDRLSKVPVNRKLFLHPDKQKSYGNIFSVKKR